MYVYMFIPNYAKLADSINLGVQRKELSRFDFM
jgi:hypothetical protein